MALSFSNPLRRVVTSFGSVVRYGCPVGSIDGWLAQALLIVTEAPLLNV
jgi:hypothetical protein